MVRIQVPSICQKCQSHIKSLGSLSSPSSRSNKIPRNRFFSTQTPLRQDNPASQPPQGSSDQQSQSTPTLTQPTSSSATGTAEQEPAFDPYGILSPRTNPSQTRTSSRFSSQSLENLAQGARAEANTRPGSGVSRNEPYHLNVYAHRHNMHITFTEPSRNPILSYSAGNIGLRKAQRSTFDAAYQLTTYTLRKMAEKQWRTGGSNATMNPMLTLNDGSVKDRGIEVILRGFGPGREAFQKALLGVEGRVVRPLVKKVTDSTRLKFGGTRSRATRRLG